MGLLRAAADVYDGSGCASRAARAHPRRHARARRRVRNRGRRGHGGTAGRPRDGARSHAGTARVARTNAALAAVTIDFHEGDVEQLPFEPGTFDVVVSQFGHMFAPRPDVAIGEMLRVLKPAGTIAFSTWPPELFIGNTFALVSRYMPPPPPGVSPPPQWGDPAVIRERLGTAVRDIVSDRDHISARPSASGTIAT